MRFKHSSNEKTLFSFCKSSMNKWSKFDNFRSSPLIVSNEMLRRVVIKIRNACCKVSTNFFLHHFQFKNSFYSQYLDLNQEDRRKTFLNFMLFTTVSRLKRCAVYAYTTPNVVMRNKNSIFNEHQYHQYNEMCSHIQVNGEMRNMHIWHKGNIGGIREEEKNFNTSAKRCRFEIVWTENQFLMCTFLTNRLSLDVSLTLTSDRSVSFSRARSFYLHLFHICQDIFSSHCAYT